MSDLTLHQKVSYANQPARRWLSERHTPKLTVDSAHTPTLTAIDPNTHLNQPQHSPQLTPKLTRLDPNAHIWKVFPFSNQKVSYP